jgi:hypothetical protein
MLGLYSAQRKSLGCIIHLEDGTTGGYLLNEAYKNFYDRYCSSCSDVEPNPDNWIFTKPWHKQQIERLKKAREDRAKKGEI